MGSMSFRPTNSIDNCSCRILRLLGRLLLNTQLWTQRPEEAPNLDQTPNIQSLQSLRGNLANPMYVHLCELIYTYIHIYTCICVCVNMCTHTYVPLKINMHHVCINPCACTYSYMHTYIHTYMHAYIHTYIHTYTYVYLYIYMYIRMCVYIYTYVRVYVCLPRHPSRLCFLPEALLSALLPRLGLEPVRLPPLLPGLHASFVGEAIS